VQQDLDQAFRMIAANDDSGQSALLPGAVHKTVDPALVALEPALITIAGHQDEGLKVAEMIVHNAINLSGKRGIPVILIAKAKPAPERRAEVARLAAAKSRGTKG